MINVKHECDSCGGTGLYCGFAEPEGTAVVCLGCKGRGWKNSTFKEFTGRKRKPHVKSISNSRGSLIVTGVGATGDAMTYAEFEQKFPS